METSTTDASSSFNRENQSIYDRAAAFEHEGFADCMVLNAKLYPNWIDDSNCFWYIRKKRKGAGRSAEIVKEFRLVNAEKGFNREAFDHDLLAKTLSDATKRLLNPDNLPITDLKLDLETDCVGFRSLEKNWLFDPLKGKCEEVSVNSPYWLVSPDGSKAAFLRDYNLWVRDLSSGEEHAVTRDGERHYAYGTKPERVNLVAGLNDRSWVNKAIPEALWSPNSKMLLTIQVDERKVLPLTVMQYVPIDRTVRPLAAETKYALPGDSFVAEYKLLAVNVETGEISFANYPPILDAVLWAGLFSGNRAWWSKDSCVAYFVDMQRGQTQASVVCFNTQTAMTHIMFEEYSTTYIDLNLHFENPASLLPIVDSNELIWFSERSGWAHLYLYDMNTGDLKNPITCGDWLVREVLYFDAVRRDVIIQVAGRVDNRDPYYREICRVNVDTGALISLISGDYDCVCHKSASGPVKVGIMLGQATNDCFGVSPDGRYMVITRSRADLAPITELMDRDGELVLPLEVADISGLPKGWQWPETVKLLAADGKTEIYGLVFRPSDFSPNKVYPVLDWAVSNPFVAYVPKGSFGNDPECGYAYMSAAAYAELGFITVIIDGRGSCYRSKAFHDEAYGQVHTASNLEDHVAGIHQLADRYPYMDLNRVGITDTSGSNAPIYGLLKFPDFYKVGAVISTWDVRLLTQGETYQGMLPNANYEHSVLGNMVSNLEGKLLLIHGMEDRFFQVSGVFQLIDALVRENKDFDLVMLPNGGHVWDSCQYGIRRMWDYLVTHLHDYKPPAQFKLSSGLEYAIEKMQSELQ